jgi:hypothetical protein
VRNFNDWGLPGETTWEHRNESGSEVLDLSRPARFVGDGTPFGPSALRDELDRLCAAQVGIRNHQLNRSAFAVAQIVAGGELLEDVALSSLLATGLGLNESDSRQTIEGAFVAGFRHPRCAPHRMR